MKADPKKDTAPETGLTSSENLAVAERIEYSISPEMEGEVTSKDVVTPTLNIVQMVGPLSETHKPGQILLNKEMVLSDGLEPVEIVVLRGSKSYQEDVEWGEDRMPQRFQLEQEVVDSGGTLDYEEGVVLKEKPYFKTLLTTLIMVKGDVDQPEFAYVYEDAAYELALWRITGAAYTRAGKNIVTAAKRGLRAGLPYGKWTLTTKREKFGKNLAYVPVFKMVGKNTDDFVKWVRDNNLSEM